MRATRESPRKRSRAAALQVLFALEFSAHEGPTPDAQTVFDEACQHFELPDGARSFAKEIVLGVAAHREALDALLAAHARHWRVARMASVDRNVLRLAAWELAHGDTPTPVVIDEAVELARRFGGERSPAFVNGVLDALAATVRPREAERA